MLKKKAVLILIGLLLMVVACNAPVQKEVEIETKTAVSVPVEVDETATHSLRTGRLFSRMRQTDDGNEPIDDEFFDDELLGGLWGGVDWLALAAESAGMDDEALWGALMDGASIADLVTANGGDPAALIETITTEEAAWMNSMVDAGEITAEEAAMWGGELGGEVEGFVNDNLWASWEGVDWFTIAAEAIGVDGDALWEAESIAAVAQKNGVETQAVVDAIIAAETAWMDKLVANDEMTADDAAEWMAEMGDEIRGFVEGSWEFDDFDEFEGVDWFTVAADTLNMDEDTFWEALMEGGSIAALSTTQNVDVQTLTDAIIAAESASFAELVADESITQEEADEWTVEIGEEVPEFLNDSSWALWEGIDWYAIAQEALGMDEGALWDTLDSGQSLVELADAQGVDGQTIADSVAAAETEWMTRLVASGELTQEEMDEWTVELDAEIDFFMNEKWDGEY